MCVDSVIQLVLRTRMLGFMRCTGIKTGVQSAVRVLWCEGGGGSAHCGAHGQQLELTRLLKGTRLLLGIRALRCPVIPATTFQGPTSLQVRLKCLVHYDCENYSYIDVWFRSVMSRGGDGNG